mgnify:CR=1 FL=1
MIGIYERSLCQSYASAYRAGIKIGEAETREDALKQVMAILLSNAVQHTPSGTQIELSAVAAGRTVCLSVADTGPGIADKERAFQKFYRADPQTGDASLGLGLSIAQKLVALHHGSITIRDTPGGGATLQVTIPQA